MDRTMRLNAVIRFVETHVGEDIGHRDLERAVGLSYRQLREDWRRHSGVPLGRYVLSRKIAYAALEMETTDKTLLEIATAYGFAAYDTFTRCFRREVGVTPSAYRRGRCRRVRIAPVGMGTYAPVLETTPPPPAPSAPDGCVLYGVPRVGYDTGKCTPFPACLESLLAYTGCREQCAYPRLMAAAGIAFRLLWNPGEWDPTNPDIRNMNPRDPWAVYRDTCLAAGRSCEILAGDTATGEVLADRIRASIADGQPVIALGVVGPPEACLVTGWRQGGRLLLGWSFFQQAPEFADHVQTADSGYFQASGWERRTRALLIPGGTAQIPPLAKTLSRIHAVLTARGAGRYRAGQDAYNAWAADILDDAAFRESDITPILLRRFFCQADAETVLGEGRYWGAQFFQSLGRDRPDVATLCRTIARLFSQISDTARCMTAARRGTDQSEQSVRLLCDRGVREEIAALIRRARDCERRAADLVRQLIDAL